MAETPVYGKFCAPLGKMTRSVQLAPLADCPADTLVGDADTAITAATHATVQAGLSIMHDASGRSAAAGGGRLHGLWPMTSEAGVSV